MNCFSSACKVYSFLRTSGVSVLSMALSAVQGRSFEPSVLVLPVRASSLGHEHLTFLVVHSAPAQRDSGSLRLVAFGRDSKAAATSRPPVPTNKPINGGNHLLASRHPVPFVPPLPIRCSPLAPPLLPAARSHFIVPLK